MKIRDNVLTYVSNSDVKNGTIIIPNVVTRIYEDAFYGCTLLEEISIPKGVTKIEDGTFHGCTSLKKVKILGNVTKIGAEAFRGCISLKKINIPKSIRKIEMSAFRDCKLLEKISIPYGILEIDEFAFYGCKNLNLDLKTSLFFTHDFSDFNLKQTFNVRCLKIYNIEVDLNNIENSLKEIRKKELYDQIRTVLMNVRCEKSQLKGFIDGYMNYLKRLDDEYCKDYDYIMDVVRNRHSLNNMENECHWTICDYIRNFMNKNNITNLNNLEPEELISVINAAKIEIDELFQKTCLELRDEIYKIKNDKCENLDSMVNHITKKEEPIFTKNSQTISDKLSTLLDLDKSRISDMEKNNLLVEKINEYIGMSTSEKIAFLESQIQILNNNHKELFERGQKETELQQAKNSQTNYDKLSTLSELDQALIRDMVKNDLLDEKIDEYIEMPTSEKIAFLELQAQKLKYNNSREMSEKQLQKQKPNKFQVSLKKIPIEEYKEKQICKK